MTTNLTPQSAPATAANHVRQAVEILEMVGAGTARDLATYLASLEGDIRKLKVTRFYGKQTRILSNVGLAGGGLER